MASLTKLTSLTGNEEFQVSATQKVTATQIANKVQLNQVLMGGFEAISINGVEKIKDTNSLIGAMKILYSLSGNGRAKVIGNSENCFGLVSINTAGTLAFGILFDIRNTTPPSIFIRDGFGLTGGASLKNLTDDQWIAELKKGEKIPMESGSGVADPIQIHDFAEVSAIDNWPTPKDGLIIPFVTDSGVLNKPGNESEYVGIIICEVDTQNTGRAEVIAYGSGTGACYVGLLDYASVSIEWMVNKMSVAGKKLSAFTGTAIGNYIQSMGNAGDLFPFVTVNANKTTANQFPANGAWSGFVTIGDGGGVNIIAFKSTTDPNAEVYVGRCSGGTTQWTAVGGGGASNVLHGENIVEGLEYMIPENVGDVVAFRITGDSSQVPNTTEGFGLLGKINGSESLLMAVQINPNNTYEELFYTGRVQNDGSGTDWHPIGISTANGANFPQKLLSNFTAVFDKIGEGDTLMVLVNIVGTGTAMSNGGNIVAYLQVGNSMINKEQTLYYGRDIDDQSIVRVLAELNSFDTDGAEFTFYTDDPAGILDATLIKVYRLPK